MFSAFQQGGSGEFTHLLLCLSFNGPAGISMISISKLRS